MYRGHSGTVANVKFSHDGGYLVSIGDGDRSIFQWRYSHDKEAALAQSELEVTQGFTIDEPLKPDRDAPEIAKPHEGVGGEEEEDSKKKRLISDIAHSQPKSFVPSLVTVFMQINIMWRRETCRTRT